MDLIDLDPDPWIDFLAWHQICVVTMDLSAITGLCLTLFAITEAYPDLYLLLVSPWTWSIAMDLSSDWDSWLNLATSPWPPLLTLLRGWWNSCSAGPRFPPGSLSLWKQLTLLCPKRGTYESIGISMPACPRACWTWTSERASVTSLLAAGNQPWWPGWFLPAACC